MSWAWPRLQKSGPAKTGPAGPLATALARILTSCESLALLEEKKQKKEEEEKEKARKKKEREEKRLAKELEKRQKQQ